MDRRSFLGLAASAGLVGVLSGRLASGTGAPPPLTVRHPLPRIPAASPSNLTLTAHTQIADVGAGHVEAWTLNGAMPSPTIRARQGELARIRLLNHLPEETILHWHGLAVPFEADGHPRWQIGPGSAYDYEFRVVNRAGTYWYHPHTHMRTAAQIYRGMGGLFIVGDEQEASYALPSGDREIPLIVQDKRLAGGLSLAYEQRMGPDMMLGHLGDTAFGNGVPDPTVAVRPARHRLRVLNACNARILELGLSTGEALTLIGSDGGLLAAPVAAERILLGPAERADVLIDFSDRRPGERVMLRSHAFEIPGMMMGVGGGPGGRGMARARGMMMGMMGGGPPQGTEMDLLEFVVGEGPVEDAPPLPARFAEVPDRGAITADTPRKTFRFQSMMMSHTINGLTFDPERVDARVRRDRTEVWTFVNESGLPHPVHVHAGQFRVLRRSGGRNRVMAWETGLKDTVLTLPGERVDVAVRFVYPGVFLLHCHNLEHEDMGMMINFEVTE